MSNDEDKERRSAARSRLLLLAEGRANISTAIGALEDALGCTTAALGGITNPVLDDLRQAILDGRKILAKSSEIIRRIPT